MDEHIRLLKLQAFHEGFIAGYQRGIEDSRAGGQEIWKIRNLGTKGLHEIAQALWNLGIRDSQWNEWL